MQWMTGVQYGCLCCEVCFNNKIVRRNSTETPQKFLRKSSERPQKVLRNPSECSQNVLRKSTESPQKIVGRSLESHQKVLRKSSGSTQKIIRKSSDHPSSKINHRLLVWLPTPRAGLDQPDIPYLKIWQRNVAVISDNNDVVIFQTFWSSTHTEASLLGWPKKYLVYPKPSPIGRPSWLDGRGADSGRNQGELPYDQVNF